MSVTVLRSRTGSNSEPTAAPGALPSHRFLAFPDRQAVSNSRRRQKWTDLQVIATSRAPVKNRGHHNTDRIPETTHAPLRLLKTEQHPSRANARTASAPFYRPAFRTGPRFG